MKQIKNQLSKEAFRSTVIACLSSQSQVNFIKLYHKSKSSKAVKALFTVLVSEESALKESTSLLSAKLL